MDKYYYNKSAAEQGNYVLESVGYKPEDTTIEVVLWESDMPFSGYPIVEGENLRAATRAEMIEMGLDFLKPNEVIVDGEVVTKPPTVAEVKLQKRAEVKARRDLLEQTYFIYDGGKFDSNADAAPRLAIACQTAIITKTAGIPFSPIDWTLYDNSERVMTQDDLIAVIPAFAAWSGAVHKFASVLKAQIDACTTIEELDAIAINVGWPTPELVAGM